MNTSMLILRWLAVASVALVVPLNFETVNASVLQDELQLQQTLKQRIEAGQVNRRFVCRNELICGIAELPRYYAAQDFKPAWVNKPGFYQMARAMIDSIREAHRDGLNPHDYHLVNLELLLGKIKRMEADGRQAPSGVLADMDMLLTDSFLLLGSHLLAGRVDPETIHTEWLVANPQVNLKQILHGAVQTARVAPALNRLKPPHTGYNALRQALERYRRIVDAGGWPLLPLNGSWQQGDYGVRYAMLRTRLELTGDLEPNPSTSRFLFDKPLANALRRFQYRHGLAVTGLPDKRTLKALNVTAARRAKQIELNLERWRWIPHDMGSRRIEVNIADFKLSAYENNRKVMSMRVVVGRNYRKTPVFSKPMKYLVINPYWNIPQKIAYEDILPKVHRDPNYLKRRQIRVFESWARGAPEIDPARIDWKNIQKDRFVYKFRKEPGPRNDLGRIKFMFPNKFAVYLHDTPAKKLFSKPSRGFSSGCIRVEKPVELAEFFLRDDPDWNRASILEAIETNDRQVVHLQQNVPVHLLYRTAWVAVDGLLHFRADVYDRDKPLTIALAERPPRI